jgi:hypothetical protein
MLLAWIAPVIAALVGLLAWVAREIVDTDRMRADMERERRALEVLQHERELLVTRVVDAAGDVVSVRPRCSREECEICQAEIRGHLPLPARTPQPTPLPVVVALPPPRPWWRRWSW